MPLNDVKIWFIGTDLDKETLNMIYNTMKHKDKVIYYTNISLIKAAAVIDRCNFLVGMDSCLAHFHFPGWRFNSLIYQNILFCINELMGYMMGRENGNAPFLSFRYFTDALSPHARIDSNACHGFRKQRKYPNNGKKSL